MIEIEKIFLLSDSDKRDSFRAQEIDEFIEKDYLFSHDNDGEVIEFQWLMGSKFYDIVPTGYAGVYLVSEKIQSILTGSGFKGYTLRSIILKNKRNELVPGYQLLSICSKVGPILNEKSIKKMMPPVVPWGDPYEAYVGLYFDLSTWDGSHFFFPEGTSYIFVVEEVKKLFEENNVANCRFDKVIDLENYGIR